MSKLVFLDTETTGLDRERDHVWDIGLIVREPGRADVEHVWQVRPDLSTASPDGLRIGRYYERIGSLATADVGIGRWIDGELCIDDFMTAREIAGVVAGLLDRAIIVGAVPDFDQAMLGRFLRAHGQALTAHYHLVDVETLAAGALRMPPPWGLDDLLRAYGLRYDEAERHTAIGDARMVRDLYDAVMGGRLVDTTDPNGYRYPAEFIQRAPLTIGGSGLNLAPRQHTPGDEPTQDFGAWHVGGAVA